jgi:hypothetical protein
MGYCGRVVQAKTGRTPHVGDELASAIVLVGAMHHRAYPRGDQGASDPAPIVEENQSRAAFINVLAFVLPKSPEFIRLRGL